MTKVCYFTSKKSTDTRIFHKECVSLAKAGYEVYLISPNANNEVIKGVQILGVTYNAKGLYSRLFKLPKILYEKALSVDADIYHFNDPASLGYGVKLKKLGKKVIFDSFEDHPTLFLEKKMPYLFKKIFAKFYSIYEYKKCKNFDGLIFCYHWTRDRLFDACSNHKMIFNFPIIGVDTAPIPKGDRDKVNLIKNNNCICYTGLLSPMWKIENIISALTRLDNIKLNLAGNREDVYLNILKNNSGWSKVNDFGLISYEEVFSKVISKSSVGMALLDYIPLCRGKVGNLSNNKLFEYLKSGIPVICTDFTLWKEVIEANNCGICVNPNDINEIANAIKYLINNPEIAKQMGQNGRRIIEEKYNWLEEEKKLLDLYKNIKLKKTTLI